MQIEQLLIGAFIVINIMAFILVGSDKRKSIRGGSYDRTPEGHIFFLAIMFGAVGVYAAMHCFRHKTRKWYFQLGIPLLVVENIATFFLLSKVI